MSPTDVEVAIAAAVAGAEAAARHYGSAQVRIAKSTSDLATQADLDSENAIMSILAEHRPHDARVYTVNGVTPIQERHDEHAGGTIVDARGRAR